MVNADSGHIHSCRKEHRVAQAHQAGVAKQDVESYGIACQNHDLGKRTVMISREDELQEEKKNQDSRHKHGGFSGSTAVHLISSPNNPVGFRTRTAATKTVASIFARVGS